MAFWSALQDQRFTVSIHENDGSPHVEIREGRVKIVREYWIPYSHRYQAVLELLGYTVGTAYGFVRVLPHRDPEDSWLFATGVSVEPFGANEAPENSTYCIYPKAKLTVEYEQPEYDIEGDEAYISEDLDGTAEFLTMPTDDLSWDPAGDFPLDSEEIAAYLRKMMTLTITWHEMPYIPTEMWSLWGKLNDIGVYSPKYNETFPAGELLFGIPKATERNKDTGQRLYDIVLSATRMPGGWNNILRYVNTGDGYAWIPSPVYKNGNLYTPYLEATVGGILPEYML